MNVDTRLLEIVPSPQTNWRLDWPLVEHTILGPFLTSMKKTPQSRRYHGEGDVWVHTRMVVTELVQMDGFRAQDERGRLELLLAALLHDVGKITTTHQQAGDWVCPFHPYEGAQVARSYLWREFGLAGDPDLRNIRETVALLIKYHCQPFQLYNDENAGQRLLRITSNAALAPDYTFEKQVLLARANMRGRIYWNSAKAIAEMDAVVEVATALGCLNSAYPFPTDATLYAYCNGATRDPDTPFKENTCGEAIILGALPSTGKDLYCEQYFPGYPVITLENIRTSNGIHPDQDKTIVMDIAKAQALEYIDARQPFVWNAASLRGRMRSYLSDFFRSNGASVKEFFLETSWEEMMRRNSLRPEPIPEQVLFNMLRKCELPERYEADQVEWVCF